MKLIELEEIGKAATAERLAGTREINRQDDFEDACYAHFQALIDVAKAAADFLRVETWPNGMSYTEYTLKKIEARKALRAALKKLEAPK